MSFQAMTYRPTSGLVGYLTDSTLIENTLADRTLHITDPGTYQVTTSLMRQFWSNNGTANYSDTEALYKLSWTADDGSVIDYMLNTCAKASNISPDSTAGIGYFNNSNNEPVYLTNVFAGSFSNTIIVESATTLTLNVGSFETTAINEGVDGITKTTMYVVKLC
jgi:hypothetical protein